MAFAQQEISPLEFRLHFESGSYKPADIILRLEKEEIDISFPSAALVKSEIELEAGSYPVEELLQKIFDGETYRWMLRKGKILVIPTSNTKVKTYSGFVEEAGSNERLVGVNIWIPELKIGTTTNSFGYYSISLPGDEPHAAVISFIGYQNHSATFSPSDPAQQDFLLKLSSEELQEVEVTDRRLISETVQMSELQLNPTMLKDIPVLLGEVDVLKALQLMPGVQSGNEGSSGLYVRGGSPDQNLILLDGVPVYNVNHLFGFFSVFNSDAIKNVSLTKGGFPARYGGRLSSVLNIDMKEGNMQEFHGAGSIGLLAARATVEGPIVKGKTSFAVSGRRTYLDLLLKPVVRSESIDKLGYHFNDINAKINHRFSRTDHLYLSFYSGLDKFILEDKTNGQEDYFNLNWGNYTGALRWNHIFNKELFGNLTATYSRYRYYSESAYSNPSMAARFTFTSKIEDYGLRYDFEYQPMVNHKLRYGASYTYHTFTPGLGTMYDSLLGVDDSLYQLASPIYTHDSYLYAEDEWSITKKLKANLGLHYSTYALKGAFYHSLQPRVSMRYMLKNAWSVKASYARMAQYIHLLTNSNAGLPNDLWVSSNDVIRPQFSQQVALGTFKNFSTDWELSAEVYYKKMRNLIAYKEGTGFLTSSNWENSIETDGQGEAYGLELFIRKNQGQLTGWVGYTLAHSTRRFSNIADGSTFPYRYDRRHDFSLTLQYKFSKRFDIGMNWIYTSGMAFTAPIAYYDMPSNDDQFPTRIIEYSDRNSQRMPAYHRMDVGFNFHKETSWGKRTWSLSAYNVYSRRNPFFIYVNQTRNQYKIKQVSLFPIIPTVTYRFEF